MWHFQWLQGRHLVSEFKGHGTPQDKVDSNILPSGKALHQIVCRILRDEVSNVEYTDQEAEFLANEVCLRDDTVRRCSGDSLY
jgi:hypothetical protein